MSKLYFDILDKQRLIVFNKLKNICQKNWNLGGGTAIALQINHRKSYDFDIFLPVEIPFNLLTQINQHFYGHTIRPTVDTKQELSLFLDEKIKITFFYFPFPHLHSTVKTSSIDLFSVSDLASNKAYVIGRRGEWKDYVDLYFLLKNKNIKVDQLLKETKKRFKGNFDEKLFWEQLIYWNDLKDFSIEYVTKKIPKSKIQDYFDKLVKNKF